MDPMRIEQTASAQLAGGERLLWCGTPRPSRVALQALPISLFGIPFGGFAAFWITMAWSTTSRRGSALGLENLFPLFGLPFLLLGLGMISAPFWAWLGARRTVYVVTDHRVMIIEGSRARSVRSYEYADVRALIRFEREDGSGDLLFSLPPPGISPAGTNQSRIGFYGIPSVRQVEELMRSHLRQAA